MNEAEVIQQKLLANSSTHQRLEAVYVIETDLWECNESCFVKCSLHGYSDCAKPRVKLMRFPAFHALHV